MLDKTKCNPKLGKEVNDYLTEMGVQTPILKSGWDDETKINEIEKHFEQIMTTLDLNLEDDSLAETPRRVAKMFVKELYWGLNPDYFPKCTTVENKMKYDEMIIEKDITCMSSCEHHFVTIDSKCSIAYIPNKKVLGLSKLNRIVEYFARRPQIQERLTEQIFHALCYILGTNDIAVVVKGVHYCVKSRGIQDYNSSTITSKIGGRFEEQSVRDEFLTLSGLK